MLALAFAPTLSTEMPIEELKDKVDHLDAIIQGLADYLNVPKNGEKKKPLAIKASSSDWRTFIMLLLLHSMVVLGSAGWILSKYDSRIASNEQAVAKLAEASDHFSNTTGQINLTLAHIEEHNKQTERDRTEFLERLKSIEGSLHK